MRPVAVKRPASRPDDLRRIQSGRLKGLGDWRRLCWDGGDDDACCRASDDPCRSPCADPRLGEERAAIEAENSRIASEISTLTAANADLAAVNQTADTRIAELAAIVKMLERTLYGTRSEPHHHHRRAVGDEADIRLPSDGRIEIDSKTVERAIRPQTRQENALFAGSNGGGRPWPRFCTHGSRKLSKRSRRARPGS